MAEELGWKEELERLHEEGTKRLKKEWAELAEGDTSVKRRADTDVKTVAEEVKEAATRSDDLDVEQLERLVEKQLNVHSEGTKL